jgi:hypothetical protein
MLECKVNELGVFYPMGDPGSDAKSFNALLESWVCEVEVNEFGLNPGGGPFENGTLL